VRQKTSFARLQIFMVFILLGASLVLLAVRGSTQTAPPENVRARQLAEGGNDATGFDMAPETRLEVVQAAVGAIPITLPAGSVKPAWDSLETNYRVPQWFYDAKFGIFMHWGVYAVPAYHNEWYEQHMYDRFIAWHRDHFGPIDRFGYKDFIPMFTAARWNPNAWAELFRKSGAKYVIPTAQHHDNFANWDSAVAPWNAKQMGPKRDLIGELATAVRARGMKFGVSNHGIENFQFIHPNASAASKALMAELKAKQTDIFDPTWAEFYNVADRSDEACRRFLVNWALRNVELIDKYRVDMLWFDNGVDQRYLDPLKLWVAAYYYNRAAEWGKPVSISTKKAAYAPGGLNTHTIGSIIDFEKIGPRSPAGIRPGAWQVDHPIGSTWGYTSDMTVSNPAAIVGALADTVSKNGNLLLNISPMADGTIPKAQQQTLLALGKWLEVNGDAIYGTHNWIKFGESDARASNAPDVRYTVKDDTVFAIVLGTWSGGEVTLSSLGASAPLQGTIANVSMLGHPGRLAFKRTDDGLKVMLPTPATTPPYAYVLKIAGLKMNPSTATESGNPQ
jgi:alpha-L-fucosidase